MITKWTVANFKSIAKETTLELAPLTIFAGANSSGKSAFLQTILMISQTLADKDPGQPVLLNGPLVRLGRFENIRSEKANSGQVTVAWECRNRLEIQDRNKPDAAKFIREIQCRISFDNGSDTTGGEARQRSTSAQDIQISAILSVQTIGHPNSSAETMSTSVTLSRGRPPEASESDWSNLDVFWADQRLDPNFRIVVDSECLNKMRAKSGFRTGELDACGLKHFLPEAFSLRYDRLGDGTPIIQSCLRGVSPQAFENYLLKMTVILPPELNDILRQRLAGAFPSLFSSNNGQQALCIWLLGTQNLSADELSKLRKELDGWPDLEGIISDAVRRTPTLVAKIPGRVAVPAGLRFAGDYIEHAFCRLMAYLGPLREGPHSLYPLAMGGETTDVGVRGEYTASVLGSQRERLIRYIPSGRLDAANIPPEIKTSSLHDAVADWMQYLGVGVEAEGLDRGSLGHELKISPIDGVEARDLTQVGTGVSQVLPILVMALLAERDSILIFEQPELHLHPRVQSRLGDFFLSMSLLGKQCLIETHSEHLINRLRYRAAAEENTTKIIDSLKIYFVEKKDGESQFREVKVNQYGAIMDWPEGFFDEGEIESESILRAAMAKRQSRKGE